MCSYNPAQPTPVYFTLGNAIAALALTLAVQQLLKPIYIFRLRAYRLKIIYFVFLGFLGFACAVIAMLLPNLPISHGWFFQYPIVWELAGGLLIGLAYTAAAFVLLTPARIYAFNLVPFIRAGSTLLAEADDVDRASFAEDLLGRPHNIARLISYASAWPRAESHGDMVEMERLRENGAPMMIQGRAPISAFYRFAHRKELEAARHAGTFLRIISDPQFCSVLVRKCPWLTAGIVSEINKREMYADQAKSFVQEIARQAIINDESMMAKEVSYDGSGIMPVLSNTLFTDWFILFYYNPLGKMSFSSGPEPSSGYVSRLNGASKLMLESAIRNRDYWEHSYMYGVESAYESLFQQLSYRRYKGTPSDFLVSVHMGVVDLYKSTLKGLESLEPERR
jgi:hypothetical protein